MVSVRVCAAWPLQSQDPRLYRAEISVASSSHEFPFKVIMIVFIGSLLQNLVTNDEK